MENENLSEAMMERILIAALSLDVNLYDFRNKLQIIFNDYVISPKETAMVVYTEGKNEIFLKRFILAKAVKGLQKRTLEQYRAEISRTLEKIGKDADTITSIDIQVYLARLLTNGCTKSYCDTVRRYMNTFYSYLYKEELISTNPMNKVEGIKYHREKEPAFTDMEIEQMRSVCKDNRERAMFELLLSTGCRASELASIRTDDLKAEEVTILGKGGKYRTVYINAKASVALKAYVSERRDANPYLFAGGSFQKTYSRKNNWYKEPEMVSDDRPINAESVNDIMKRIAKRAGVENAHAHRFRKTCATMALRHGMPIEFVSMMLGHEQIATTQIYLDIQQSDLALAHKKYVV